MTDDPDIPEEAAEIVLAYAPEAIREAIRQLDHDMFGEAYETEDGRRRLDPTLVTVLRKPCQHGRYEEHSQYRRHIECDGWTWTEKVFTCPGGEEPSTADLMAELERRGFVGRFAGWKAP